MKQMFQYYYVIISWLHSIKIDKVCFFYLPDVPDFGKEFTYIKLGKKEDISNPNGYSVIFEAELPYNLSKYNEYFMDYSGLYALYKNNLVKQDYLLLIHYDTKILHKKWVEIIKSRVTKYNVVFSTWPIDKERAEICKWVYERIDNMFLQTHKKTFLSFLKANKLDKIPNSSQFACHREMFLRLMEFLMPMYDYILTRTDLSYRYAHVLERAWGLFFALEGYKKVSVIKDSHTQDNSKRYAQNVIDFPILSTALEQNVTTFLELFKDQKQDIVTYKQ